MVRNTAEHHDPKPLLLARPKHGDSPSYVSPDYLEAMRSLAAKGQIEPTQILSVACNLVGADLADGYTVSRVSATACRNKNPRTFANIFNAYGDNTGALITVPREGRYWLLKTEEREGVLNGLAVATIRAYRRSASLRPDIDSWKSFTDAQRTDLAVARKNLTRLSIVSLTQIPPEETLFSYDDKLITGSTLLEVGAAAIVSFVGNDTKISVKPEQTQAFLSDIAGRLATGVSSLPDIPQDNTPAIRWQL